MAITVETPRLDMPAVPPETDDPNRRLFTEPAQYNPNKAVRAVLYQMHRGYLMPVPVVIVGDMNSGKISNGGMGSIYSSQYADREAVVKLELSTNLQQRLITADGVSVDCVEQRAGAIAINTIMQAVYEQVPLADQALNDELASRFTELGGRTEYILTGTESLAVDAARSSFERVQHFASTVCGLNLAKELAIDFGLMQDSLAEDIELNFELVRDHIMARIPMYPDSRLDLLNENGFWRSEKSAFTIRMLTLIAAGGANGQMPAEAAAIAEERLNSYIDDLQLERLTVEGGLMNKPQLKSYFGHQLQQMKVAFAERTPEDAVNKRFGSIVSIAGNTAMKMLEQQTRQQAKQNFLDDISARMLATSPEISSQARRQVQLEQAYPVNLAREIKVASEMFNHSPNMSVDAYNAPLVAFLYDDNGESAGVVPGLLFSKVRGNGDEVAKSLYDGMPVTLDETAGIVEEMGTIMKQMLDNGIVDLDLHLRNWLRDSHLIKIDYGMAAVVDRQSGVVDYPEQLYEEKLVFSDIKLFDPLGLFVTLPKGERNKTLAETALGKSFLEIGRLRYVYNLALTSMQMLGMPSPFNTLGRNLDTTDENDWAEWLDSFNSTTKVFGAVIPGSGPVLIDRNFWKLAKEHAPKDKPLHKLSDEQITDLQELMSGFLEWYYNTLVIPVFNTQSAKPVETVPVQNNSAYTDPFSFAQALISVIAPEYRKKT